jgi:hypothetical protein
MERHWSTEGIPIMVLQARQVLQSDAFRSTLRASVKYCASCAAQFVARSISAAASAQLPQAAGDALDASDLQIVMAFAVPVISQVPEEMLSEGCDMRRGMLESDEVQTLLLDVYARGPFIGSQAEAAG